MQSVAATSRVAFAPLGAVRPQRTTARAPVAVRATAASRVSAAASFGARKQASFAAGLAGLSAPVRPRPPPPSRTHRPLRTHAARADASRQPNDFGGVLPDPAARAAPACCIPEVSRHPSLGGRARTTGAHAAVHAHHVDRIIA